MSCAGQSVNFMKSGAAPSSSIQRVSLVMESPLTQPP